jgi:methylase of polypeptide subunit release factors
MDARADRTVGRLLERHREIIDPSVFRLLGREWDLLPGVYAPQLTPSAALYAEWVPYPLFGEFCEVGCGTGYIAVTAALRGCTGVTALDVSQAAADNTARNARRHGVADRVRVACSDMFSALSSEDRFDLIFWNSNFIETDGPHATSLDAAFFDPGYAAHEAYFRDASAHLEPGGRLMLGFTDLGNEDRLTELAGRYGWQPNVIRGAVYEAPEGAIKYELIEFNRA